MRTKLLLPCALASIVFFAQQNARLFAEETVPIGVIAGMSGAFADIGNGAARTIELACEEWNTSVRNSNSKKPIVECFFEDDGFDTKKGVSAFLKLQKINKIKALINVNSTTLPAIKPLLLANNIPTVQVFMEGSTAAVDNIFQICPEVEIAEEALGKEVSKKYPGKVSIVMSTNEAVTRLADAFERGFGRPAPRFEIPIGSTDVKPIVLQVIQSKPDAILFITTPEHGALIEKELRALQVATPRIFDANFVSAVDEYVKVLGDLSSLSSSLLLNVPLPDSKEKKAFIKKYSERFHSTPPPWFEFSYDGFYTLLNAYSNHPSEWVANLQKTAYVGFSGKVEFSEKGLTIPVYEFTTVGEFLEKL